MKRSFSICSLSLVAVAACVRTNAALMDPTIHLAETCRDAIKLYTSPAAVQQPYREIALLNSSGESTWSDESNMIKSMRDKAAEVGANGIILTGIDEPSALSKVIGDVAQTGTVRKGKSLAIYVPSDSARVRTVCATAQQKK